MHNTRRETSQPLSREEDTGRTLSDRVSETLNRIYEKNTAAIVTRLIREDPSDKKCLERKAMELEQFLCSLSQNASGEKKQIMPQESGLSCNGPGFSSRVRWHHYGRCPRTRPTNSAHKVFAKPFFKF
ncbi:uncharacterized protein PITG_15951 [Phytophthora infestans T30-4]|uniref:Uncharacterized protein n=1 Tax=Phytophthora infestans (strain T30-4) TaxID=403677 RepID=D0NS38_PHYIT|nr:uncharacterized protein PITG_15951 [Phytophthora infestans T30-4]EEY63579.1 hypothetical protein PITG_15951 [Phytophthora infestans T30-4]|eukprot:XP_002898166.1 hypothetical protein PITG_15951 [Phytophthora infestans T30-4]